LAVGVEDLDFYFVFVEGAVAHCGLGGGDGGVYEGGGGGGEVCGCAGDEGAEGEVVEDFAAVSGFVC
jgi:hypothetical protein